MNYFDSDDTDDEMLLVFVAQQKRRRYWTREIFLKREQLGEFHQYVPRLMQDPEKFQNYYRMSMKCFTTLVRKVKPLFHVGSTNFRKTISFEERITVTLRFLAAGESFAASSHHFCISANEIGIIIKDTLHLIYKALHREHLRFPQSKNEWLRVANEFECRKHFPNCLGALDGKHVRIRKPGKSGSLFYNYKLYHSIVLLALVSADYKFLMIDVGSYGRNSDGGILEHSQFGKDLHGDKLNLPPDKPIIQGDDPMPYVFIGDEAFRLTRNFMKPYPRRQLTDEKRIFNYRLSSARQMVECTFGALTSKFRIFDTPLGIIPDTVDLVIKAACILHNMVKDEDGEILFQETLNTPVFHQMNAFDGLPMGNNVRQSTREARTIRDKFLQYFNGVGAINDQNEKILQRYGLLDNESDDDD